MAIKSEAVEAFIAEAEKELADILRRKTELEDLIKKCKTLFDSGPRQLPLNTGILISTQTSEVELKTNSLRRNRGKKIWEHILDLFNEMDRELSISNIVKEFENRGWPTSKNAPKIIYRAMRDKPEVFVNTNHGTWKLMERFKHTHP